MAAMRLLQIRRHAPSENPPARFTNLSDSAIYHAFM
jgi:hypothetical protein